MLILYIGQKQATRETIRNKKSKKETSHSKPKHIYKNTTAHRSTPQKTQTQQ